MERQSSDVLGDLLEPLYEAATQPEMWQTFLQRIVEALRADGGTIIFHDPSSARTSIKDAVGFTDELRNDLEHLIKFSPWMREVRKYEKQGWYCGVPEDVLPADEFSKTEFYKELLRKHQIRWRAGAYVFGPRGTVRGLAVTRVEGHPPFSDKDKHLLQELLPHLSRVFKVHRKVTSLSERNVAGLQALDRMGAACIIIAANRRVISMNKTAEELIAKTKILRVSDGRLFTARHADQNHLDACIVQACDGSSVRAVDASSCAIALRAGGEQVLYISVLRYEPKTSLVEDLEDTPAAFVFLTTREEQRVGEPRLWQEMFGMSPAECRVAEMMKHGAEVAEISDTLKIKINTVRYYQKSIYRKVKVPGQSALIRLLTRLPSSDE